MNPATDAVLLQSLPEVLLLRLYFYGLELLRHFTPKLRAWAAAKSARGLETHTPLVFSELFLCAHLSVSSVVALAPR